jgi:NAD(P)-dependent dehydrogenase (short-subunit alcohol dehydrogenase family)
MIVMGASLRNSIIIVTGAGSGIGRAAANLLEAAGATVYRTSRSGELRLDVTDFESAKNACDEVLRREGRIDALVHCAGVGVSGPLEYMDDELLGLQFGTNINGMIHMCRAVLPAMRAQGHGRIIVTGSVAGRVSIPFQSAYSASKAAVSSLLIALRSEVRGFGIQCSIVEPGDVKTGFTANRVKAVFAEHDAYEKRCDAAVSQMEHDEEYGAPPEKIAQVIVALMGRKRMPARVVCGAGYKALTLMSRILPDRVIAYIIERIYHITP